LDPEKYAAIEAECETREAQRRARERESAAAASPSPGPEPSPGPSEKAREYAAAVADGFRDLASKLRELAAGDDSRKLS
jgi:hypothetical protein